MHTCRGSLKTGIMRKYITHLSLKHTQMSNNDLRARFSKMNVCNFLTLPYFQTHSQCVQGMKGSKGGYPLSKDESFMFIHTHHSAWNFFCFVFIKYFIKFLKNLLVTRAIFEIVRLWFIWNFGFVWCFLYIWHLPRCHLALN